MALTGTNGDDFFGGTSFAEEIFALGGDDTIIGSPGADTIDGGGDDGDLDTIDYARFWFRLGPIQILINGDAVNVDLQRSVQFGGFAEGDSLIGIENVGGSRENDTVRGDGLANSLAGNGGSDTLEGRGGDDILEGDGAFVEAVGDSGNDRLDGGPGDDQLFGNDGDDTLIGGLDNDELFGEGGNDTLFGDQGSDDLDGGAGIDRVTYANSAAAVIVLLASELGIGGDASGDDLINIENVTGSSFADQLFGSSVANVLEGGGGNDMLAGLGGADTLDGGFGTDSVSYVASASGVVVDLAAGTGAGGDANNDELISIENVTGSNSIDALYGSAAGNVLDGGANTDVLVGRGGNDIYIVDNAGDLVVEAAGQGIDEVRTAVSYALAGGVDIETLRTTNDNGTANINLTGSNAGNNIFGNNGDNVLDGRGGVDLLSGRGGNDLYFVDNAADAIAENAGQGSDEVRTSVSFTLTAGADVEALRTTDDNGAAAIDLTGNASGNLVRGNNGANVINGGAGNDELTGRGGQDSFFFNTALDAASNVDVIVDFTVADDTIRLDDAVFSLNGGTLAANQFVIGAAQDGDDRVIYDDTTGALFFDIDGAGGVAAVQFAQLNGGLALTNLDFFVV